VSLKESLTRNGRGYAEISATWPGQKGFAWIGVEYFFGFL